MRYYRYERGEYIGITLSINKLLNAVPLEGCLLIFHGKENSFRTECSELGLTCRALDKPPRYQEKLRICQGRLLPVYRDLYITLEDKI